MQKIGGSFKLTATDLVGYLNCHHLTELDRAVAEGRIAKPKTFDPLLEILWQRGAAHETLLVAVAAVIAGLIAVGVAQLR